MSESDPRPLLTRLAEALERLAPTPRQAADLSAADAFVWHAESSVLTPVHDVSRVDLGLLVGADHRLVLPASACLGAAFLVMCDVAARTLLSPMELPVGVITAMLGGPFFLWLLVRNR